MSGREESQAEVVMADDAIRVNRPEGMTDERWQALQGQLRDGLDKITEAVHLDGKCPDHEWCIEAGTPEHALYHSGADHTLTLDDEEHRGWSGWIVEPRRGGVRRPQIQISGRLSAGMTLEFSLDAVYLLAVLEIVRIDGGVEALHAIVEESAS